MIHFNKLAISQHIFFSFEENKFDIKLQVPCTKKKKKKYFLFFLLLVYSIYISPEAKYITQFAFEENHL